MNTISYEGVVFTRDARRLHRAADKSLRRFARSESCAFGLKRVHSVSGALRATLASFRMAAGKVDAGPRPSAASNCLATGSCVQPSWRQAKLLICGNYVVVATSNIGSRMLMESRSSGLAKRIGISSPFLSDIELGRRFPSEEILAKLAGGLEVSPDELKQYDTAPRIADLKRLIDSDPKLGFAFRTVVEKVKNGEVTAEDIIVKLSKRKSRA